MRRAGAPQEVIEKWRRENSASVEVPVLPENMPTLAVFLRCLPAHLGAGLSGAVCLGIAATEVLAALLLSGVPRREWRRFSDDVQLMSRAYAKAANRR